MQTAICTISSSGHLYKTEALFSSLSALTDASFHCLMTDSDSDPGFQQRISSVHLSELVSETAVTIKKKYRNDQLRWACKPLLLMHLLDKGYDKVIYVDNDICFYESPDFLFDLLNENSVLLTPHYYLADPDQHQHWLEANFRIGLYNAGFIGINQDGKSSMQWWARCCAYNVKKASWRGLFDDQRYLDLLPVKFDRVHILKHRGCNVASWNVDQSPRSVNGDGKVVLSQRWPLVFIHFNGFTMRAISNGADPELRPFLDSYFGILKKFNPDFSSSDFTRYGSSDAFNYVRHLWWSIIRKLD